MSRASIFNPRVEPSLPDRVQVDVSTPYARGGTIATASLSPARAELIAHQLIIAAAEVRARRQSTTDG
jgi:hypothetical protein